MKLELIQNSDLDLSIFEENLLTIKEMKRVNPTATLPFDEGYWLNFFKDGDPTYSLLLIKDNETIGHTALKQKLHQSTKVFLCFVFIKKEFRGQGYTQLLLKSTEGFLTKKFNVKEYFLNVNAENSTAIKCYENFGFTETEKTSVNIEMSKTL
jgi:RimJ/RimL family protein N-acetyltransferase